MLSRRYDQSLVKTKNTDCAVRLYKHLGAFSIIYRYKNMYMTMILHSINSFCNVYFDCNYQSNIDSWRRAHQINRHIC